MYFPRLCLRIGDDVTERCNESHLWLT